MDVMDKERDYRLADIANMYYKQRMTQAQISQVLGCSRSLISMMLTEAEKKGIVKIEIQYPAKRVASLEQRLRDEFDLQEALVVNRGHLDYPQALRLVGRMAAMYLQGHLPEHGVLGIGWGSTVSEVVSALRPVALPDMKIIQLSGAFRRGDQSKDGPELTHALGQLFSAPYFPLNAPAIVANVALRQALMQENQVKEVMALASRLDVAVMGLGTTDLESSTMLRTANISLDEIRELQAQGAVGDICGYHYDVNGNVLDLDINRRVVGVDLSIIRRKRCQVIAVASGENKSQAILGAVRGGFVDVLVTDNLAIERMLSL
jgi:DNA-binding transcriptional regulator LsrR (DeoR family)